MELHNCCLNGDRNGVIMCLQRGDDVNSRNDMRRTPLYISAFCGYSDVVRELLDHGADPDLQVPTPNFGGDDNLPVFPTCGGTTALHIAVYQGHLDTVKVLLDHGAYPNIQDQVGDTALNIASLHGNLLMIQELIRYNADPLIVDKYNHSALDNAQLAGYDEIRILLENYMNTNNIKEPDIL
jgi:uncharacterized protein